MRNGYIIDTLRSLDILEIDKNGGRVIETYESVIYREILQTSPFRKVIEKLSTVRQKYKEEENDLMPGLVKLITNSFYGIQIRKVINEVYKCKTKHWMQKEYDDKVRDYCK